MSYGSRVIRGPGWPKSNPEVDEGLVGTIVRPSSASSDPENIVEVVWDDGSSTQCNISKKDEPEILQFDSGPAGICHKGTNCSYCKETPITGLRWQCITDDYVNMCTACYMTGRHEQSHPFRCIHEPGAEGMQVQPRQESEYIVLHGIFLGAAVTGGRDWDMKDPNTGQEGIVIDVISWEEGQATSRSAVKVQWPSRAVGTYHVGHNGYVQLKCISNRSKEWGRCYKSHLPAAQRVRNRTTNQQAKQFKKGDFVKASDSYEARQQHSSFDRAVYGRSGVIIMSKGNVSTVCIGEEHFDSNSEDLNVNDQKSYKNELPTDLAISDKYGSSQAFPNAPYHQHLCPMHSHHAQAVQRTTFVAGVYQRPVPKPRDVPDRLFWELAKDIKSEHLEELAAYLGVSAPKVSAIRVAAPGDVTLQFVKVFQAFRNGLRQDQDCLGLLTAALKKTGLQYLLPNEGYYSDYDHHGFPPAIGYSRQIPRTYQDHYQQSYPTTFEHFEDMTLSHIDSKEKSFDDFSDIQKHHKESKTDNEETITLSENENEDNQQQSITSLTTVSAEDDIEAVDEETLFSSDLSGKATLNIPFKMGNIVRVKCMPIDDMERLQRGHGGWTQEIAWCMNSLGKVLMVDDSGCVWVKTSNGPSYSFNPECLQLVEKSEIKDEPDEGVFKKGQGVRVRDDVSESDMRHLQREIGEWIPAMTKLIGQPCIVIKVTLSKVVVKMYDGEKWALNFVLLEPYDEAATNMPFIRPFRKGERVRVREIPVELMKEKQEGYGDFFPLIEKTMGSIGIVQHVRMGRIIKIKMEDGGTTLSFNQSCLRHEDPLPGENSEADEVDFDDLIDDDIHEDIPSKLDMLLARHVPQPGFDQLLRNIVETDDSFIDRGPQVLIAACRTGDQAAAERIIRKKPEWANYMTEDGQTTPLIMACQEGYPRLARYLIDAGACIDLENGIGITPLMMAAFEDKKEIVQELLKQGANVNARTIKGGLCAMGLAISRGNEDCVQAMLEPRYDHDDADVNNLRDENGVSPSELVVLKDDPSICAMILTSDLCDPTVVNNNGFNLLHTAARKGNLQAIDLILSRNPDLINVQKNDGWTALHLATWNNHVEVARMLLSKENCYTSIKDNEGETCFHLAVKKRNAYMIQLLVDSGVEMNAQNNVGATALHLVLAIQAVKDISVQDTKLAKLLALITDDDSEANALKTEHMALAMYLVQNGAYADIADHNGNTPIDLVQDVILRQSLVQSAISRAVERANLGIEVYHPFVTCNGCLTVPLRGIRYKCSTCDDYDLCQECKERGFHSDHGFIEILQPIRQNASQLGRQSRLADQSSVLTPTNRYFPETVYVSIDESASETTMIDALRNNNRVVPAQSRCKESELGNLSIFLEEILENTSKAQVNPTQINLLRRIIFEWPVEYLLPVLDILRLSVRCGKVNEHLFARNVRDALVSRLLQIPSESPSIPIQATVCRILTNAFLHPEGRHALTNADQISIVLATVCDFEDIKRGEMPKKKSCTLRVAVASLMLNMAVAINANGASPEVRCACVNVVCDLLSKTNDSKSNFRLLVAMGTLICGNDTALATAKSRGLFAIADSLCRETDSSSEHLCECANHLKSMLEETFD